MSSLQAPPPTSLNQPLTSVMGYAEMLRRRLKADEDYGFRPAEIIYKEAERMAEIVRKIGKITRYETMPYVGSSKTLTSTRPLQMKHRRVCEKAWASLAPEAFQLFFESLEHPAALCDPELRLLAANPAFEVLFGVRNAVGQSVKTLLKGADVTPPADGGLGSRSRLWLDRTIHVALPLPPRGRRRGDGAELPQCLRKRAGRGRSCAHRAVPQRQSLLLGRQVAGTASEEQLVAVVARGVKGTLFPVDTFACASSTGAPSP